MRRVLTGFACFACALLLLGSQATPSSTSSLTSASTYNVASIPPGYAIQPITSMAWAAEIACIDDGRCYISLVRDEGDQNRSAIWVLNPDNSKQRIYRGPIFEHQHLGEKGLTGMALHPRFDQDDRIFFYWSVPDPKATFDNTTTVISSIRSDGSDYKVLKVFDWGTYTSIHVAGGMLTTSENNHDYLYVALGNADHNAWSQDATRNEGKIHRFEIVGDSLQIPSDNPFYNSPGVKQSIWAVGFRNPFRIARDTATGKIYVAENGRTCSDRIYLLEKGGNYGWPAWDDCKFKPEYVQPILEFVPTVAVTDIEVYHGPIPGWDGKVFICSFIDAPFRMFSVAPDGKLFAPEIVAQGNQRCSIGIGTRSDGALLYSYQSQHFEDGRIYAVQPINPGPRLTTSLNTHSNAVSAGQRIRYTLDVTNLSFPNHFTTTISLPNSLTYLPGSTFGGMIYNSGNKTLTWQAPIELSRKLRAGFDAVTFTPPGTPISLTAQTAETYGQTLNTNATVTVNSGTGLNVQMRNIEPVIRSGEPVTYQLIVRNSTITNTNFALTTSLPVQAQYIRKALPSTISYNAGLRALLWQRPLLSDRQASAAVVISATHSLPTSIHFTSTLRSGFGATSTTLAQFLLDPLLSYLPILDKSFNSNSPAASYLIAPEDHPFGRYGTPPGAPTQALNSGTCQTCHNVADSSIYAGWSTSAHGYSAVDPVFQAALHNATQQVQDVERWCTQCHQPENWLNGHPLTASDKAGVTCAACHRAVDATSASGIDQAAIQQAQAMNVIPPRWKQIGGNGALIVDLNDVRRGTNFLSSSAPHNVALSAFQGSSALCGTCHSVFAPHLALDATADEFVTGTPNLAGENPLFLQSTYPEWLHSQYATNDVQCQDCHMPSVAGYVADPDKGGQPRSVPEHHIAGGNLFILDIFDQSGALGDTAAQRNAVQSILSQAATVTSSIVANTINVGVTCRAGHKCPTGYEEGRAWIVQVEQLDADGERVACSGCWDEVAHTIAGYAALPGDPDYDPELTEFGIHFGISGTHALQLNQPVAQGFNLALNNTVFSDTRIPPCGWNATEYAQLGIAPTSAYAPGSCTAIAQYTLHPDAQLVVVRVLHWSHTTPYLEFLRDKGGSAGQTLWSDWQAALAQGKGQPVAIATAAQFVGITPLKLYLPALWRNP